MLKIKDNVDLKELEKFGFKPQYDRDTGEIFKFLNERVDMIFSGHKYHKSIITIFSIFNKNKKEWYFKGDIYNFSDDVQDIIYDLIKADLVEKVGK